MEIVPLAARERLFVCALRRDIFNDNTWEWPDPVCDESFYPVARDMIDHIHTLTSSHLSLAVSNTLGTQVILTNLRVLDSVRIHITFRGGMGYGRLRWGLTVVQGDLL